MDVKLKLSAEEMRLVNDPAWILTKNSVMGKVVGMMAGLSEEYVAAWAEVFRAGEPGPIAGLDPGSPKISRGENYLGLPWVMLDYPRVFGRADVLAIRTMFWWGHTFSVTLHLKGRWLELCLPVIEARREELDAAGFHAGVGDDEWRHEHDPENYRPLSETGELAEERAFLKLSCAVGLDRWAEAPSIMNGWFEMLVNVLGEVGRQFPSR